VTAETDDDRRYLVVVNDEEQYSIWPQHKRNAPGWQDAGFAGTREECLADEGGGDAGDHRVPRVAVRTHRHQLGCGIPRRERSLANAREQHDAPRRQSDARHHQHDA